MRIFMHGLNPAQGLQDGRIAGKKGDDLHPLAHQGKGQGAGDIGQSARLDDREQLRRDGQNT